MKIAYLVNRYPAASHSFIRREIEAIEAAGGSVMRFSVRPSDLTSLPDPKDISEFKSTHVILEQRYLSLILALLWSLQRSPIKFIRALNTAFRNCSYRPSDLIRRIAYLVEAAWLTKQLIHYDVSHIHAHFGTNSAMVARLSRLLGGPPFSFTVHGPDEFDRPVELDLKGKIAESEFCVAISSFCKGQLMRWSQVSDWNKIEIIRCGVDSKFLSGKTIQAQFGQPHFCAIARLSGQKGIPLLVEAIERTKLDGFNFKVTLVGGGEMMQDIRNMVIQKSLQDNVIMAGWCNSDQILEILKSSTAMVLPSFAEGLPVAIMEALALGKPVIVTSISGTPELVDNSCGWLIPSGCVDSIVKALKSAAMTSPEDLERMGEIGRRRVMELHDSRLNGAQLLKIINNYHKIRMSND